MRDKREAYLGLNLEVYGTCCASTLCNCLVVSCVTVLCWKKFLYLM